LLAIAHLLTPHPSLASANPLALSPSASAMCFGNKFLVDSGDTYHACHLDLNDRTKVDLGDWGSTIVHPHGPTVRIIFALSIASNLKKAAIGVAPRRREKNGEEHAADRH
jgi:hypothetical protein